MERWTEVKPIRTIRTAAQLIEVMDVGCSRSNMSAAFWKQVFNPGPETRKALNYLEEEKGHSEIQVE